MARHVESPIMLDTTYLDALLNKNRPVHNVATRIFEFCIKNKVLMCTSTICLAEYSANADKLHPVFKNIKVLPFNAESALLAGNMYKKYKNPVLPPNRTGAQSGERDALKDDFKIVAAAVVANINVIIHNDAKTMKRFLSCAQEEFSQCKGLVSILLSDGFDESKLRMALGLPMAPIQEELFV